METSDDRILLSLAPSEYYSNAIGFRRANQGAGLSWLKLQAV